MATSSVIAYRDLDGNLQGTYVHWDGYPDHIIPKFKEKINELGFEGVKNWIAEGVLNGGYSSVEDEEPYNGVNGIMNCGLNDESYGYYVNETGIELVYDENEGILKKFSELD